MPFHSVDFLFLFLPVTFLLFWLIALGVSFRLANVVLLGGSLLFVTINDSKSAIILCLMVVGNFLAYQLGRLFGQKSFFAIVAIVLNFSTVLFYKYLNVSPDTMRSSSIAFLHAQDYLVPLGLSFYCIQLSVFQLDSITKSEKQIEPISFGFSYLFFPKIFNGPITSFQRMHRQFYKSRLRSRFFFAGLTLLTLGLAKKVLIADTLEQILLPLSGHFYPDRKLLNWDVAVTILSGNVAHLYFDLSSYADIALGLGYLFGYSLPVNFRSPYRQYALDDFWKTWHVTLVQSLQRFLPSGNKIYYLVSLLSFFLLYGLWHGPFLGLFLFGAIQVVGLLITIYIRKQSFHIVLERIFTKALLVLVVLLSVPLLRILDLNFYFYLVESLLGNFSLKSTYISVEALAFCLGTLCLAFLAPNSVELMHLRKAKFLKFPAQFMVVLLFFVCLFFLERTDNHWYYFF